MKQTAVVLLLLCVACAPALDLPESSQVSCQTDADCPETHFCHDDGYCYRIASNSPPTMVLQPIPRSNDIVAITVQVSDSDDDVIELSGELATGNQFQPVVLAGNRVRATTDGVTTTLAWDALTYFGGSTEFVGDLVLRITADDGVSPPTSGLTEPFSFGNSVPMLSLVDVQTDANGVAQDLVPVELTVVDPDGDPVQVVGFEYSAIGNFTDATNLTLDAVHFPAGGLTGLATGAGGTTHTLLWETGAGELSASTTARIRVAVGDELANSLPSASAPFILDNSPRLVMSTPVPAGSGRFLNQVTVPFTASDPNGDNVDVLFEYTVVGPSAADEDWFVATSAAGPLTDIAAVPAGSDHTFTWNVIDDAGEPSSPLAAADVHTSGGDVPIVTYQAAVWLRAKAVDSTGRQGETVVSEAFDLGNQAPAASLRPFAGVFSRNVVIAFALTDTAFDPADVEVVFQLPGDKLWRTAAIAMGAVHDLATNDEPDTADGVEHVVIWDSSVGQNADVGVAQGIGRQSVSGVLVRVRAADDADDNGPYYGEWTAAERIEEIRNQLPPRFEDVRVPMSDVSRGTSVVPINYRLVDEEGDVTDIDIEYRLNGTDTWLRCDEYPAPRSEGRYGLATAPTGASSSGVPHTFLWDVTVIPTGHSVSSLRLTAHDGISSTTANFTMLHPAGPPALPPHDQLFVASSDGPYEPYEVTAPSPAVLGVAAADFDGDGILDRVRIF